mgnify:CR=1 FL=1
MKPAATVAVAASVKQQTKDRKESVNEQIKDAERLRAALIGAYSDSLQTEKDYLEQAKKLRAEAAATQTIVLCVGMQERWASAIAPSTSPG